MNSWQNIENTQMNSRRIAAPLLNCEAEVSDDQVAWQDNIPLAKQGTSCFRNQQPPLLLVVADSMSHFTLDEGMIPKRLHGKC